MRWVLLSKYAQCVLESVLLDLAMGCEVPACRAVVDEIVLCEKAQGACVITGGEMDLSEEESIVGVTFQSSASLISLSDGQTHQ